MKSKFLVLALTAWIGWSAASPQQANAQLRVCGPGETPIGWDNTPIPPVPLCPGGPPTSSAPPPLPSDTHAGYAIHDDASDVWVVGNHEHYEAAEARALAACNQAMGGGCRSGNYKNTALELFRDSSGILWTHVTYKGEKARTDLMDSCRKEDALPCEWFKKLPASTREYLPGPEVRNLYGVAAWPSPESKAFDSRVWVATGHRTFQSAMDAAMAACQQAHPGKNCVVFSGTCEWDHCCFLIAYTGPARQSTTQPHGERAPNARSRRRKPTAPNSKPNAPSKHSLMLASLGFLSMTSRQA
ncbi:MAG: DUF4189 domain-containing protein [Sphingopyxis sp.]|nr:DUF4189 domain-containing protein [Sphingopyxis sp.]